MGKFNFTDTPKRQEVKFENFVPIQVSKNNLRTKVEVPLLTFSASQIGFNAKFRDDVLRKEHFKFAQVSISGNLMGIRFTKIELKDSLKVMGVEDEAETSKRSHQARMSGSSIFQYLKENTDFINLAAFTYKFKIKWDKDNIYYVELDSPFEKTKLKNEK